MSLTDATQRIVAAACPVTLTAKRSLPLSAVTTADHVPDEFVITVVVLDPFSAVVPA